MTPSPSPAPCALFTSPRVDVSLPRLSRRRPVAIVAVIVVAVVYAGAASACGRGGYSYAGLAGAAPSFGVRAVVIHAAAEGIAAGHIAGWVGVGGPGGGPGGTNEWLQAGISSFPGFGDDVYYEVALPFREPVYHRVEAAASRRHHVRLAVLEVGNRHGWWRVWVNGRPVSPAIHLPRSHGRWRPIATAESWDGGSGVCNTFLYRFEHVSLAGSPGGSWHPLRGGVKITRDGTRLVRLARDAFLAAEGNLAARTAAAKEPAPPAGQPVTSLDFAPASP